MAEAFVAVADDATSIYWNPAGMATGAFVSLVVDYGAGNATPDPPDPSAKQSATFIGFTLPPVGLGYYRLQRVKATPAETSAPGRQDGRQSVQGLTTSHVGLALAQSLGDYIVVAGTVKYVQGEVVMGTVNGSPEDALEDADLLPRTSSSRADVDAGVMVDVGQWRAGLVARNLAAPGFEAPDGGRVELDREVRMGVAWGSGWPGLSRWVVSADADLTRRAAPTGERRDLAAGVETWWRQQRIGLRGGVRGSTVGGARPVVTGGVSAGIKPGVFVEGHVAQGEKDGTGWSIGARLVF